MLCAVYGSLLGCRGWKVVLFMCPKGVVSRPVPHCVLNRCRYWRPLGLGSKIVAVYWPFLNPGVAVRRLQYVSGGSSGLPGPGKQVHSSRLQWICCILSPKRAPGARAQNRLGWLAGWAGWLAGYAGLSWLGWQKFILGRLRADFLFVLHKGPLKREAWEGSLMKNEQKNAPDRTF